MRSEIASKDEQSKDIAWVGERAFSNQLWPLFRVPIPIQGSSHVFHTLFLACSLNVFM
jgi:hypothetical protein